MAKHFCIAGPLDGQEFEHDGSAFFIRVRLPLPVEPIRTLRPPPLPTLTKKVSYIEKQDGCEIFWVLEP